MNKCIELTDKKLADLRFKKTEEAILTVFFDNGRCIGVNELMKEVGVARATFYNHHRATQEIIPDYNRYILKKYKAMMADLTARDRQIGIETVYRNTLGFIAANKNVFTILELADDKKAYREMLEWNKEIIGKKMYLPNNSRKLYRIYANEIMGVFENWAEDKYSQEGFGAALKDTTFLTKTIRTRLGTLVNR